MKIRIIPCERRRVLRPTNDKNQGILIDISEEKLKDYNDTLTKFDLLNKEFDELLKNIAPKKYQELVYGIIEK